MDRMYQRGVLSLGEASRLAGLSQWAFEALLGERGISRHSFRGEPGRGSRVCPKPSVIRPHGFTFLAGIGPLGLFKAFYDKSFITPAVWQEVVESGGKTGRGEAYGSSYGCADYEVSTGIALKSEGAYADKF